MHFSIYSRALLQGTIAGAVLLAGASACSRSDRADAGRDTTQTAQTAPAVPADSQTVTATQPTQATPPKTSDTAVAAQAAPTEVASKKSETPRPTPKADAKVSGYQAMGHDTSTTGVAAGASADSSVHTDSVAVGDSAQIGKPGDRLDGADASQQANADTSANQTESDRVRPPEDSSETIGAVTTDSAQGAAVNSDSAVAGDSEMVRDTSSVLAQADTTTETQADSAAQTAADTAAIQARVDTTTTEQRTEVAVETSADTVALAEDSTQAGKAGERLEPTEAALEANADTLATEKERIPPAEDSTEALGQADTSPVGAAAVQSTGNIATGADAVALITREGQRCAVVSDDRDAQDLASSPVTMNPCGTGTMTLPKVQTGEK